MTSDSPDDLTDATEAAGGGPLRLWGGRFESGPAEALARLSVSVQFDWRLAPYDLLASAAHARVLHKAGLLTDTELARMLAALEDLGRACRAGTFRPSAHDEDVHTALERGLLERVGQLGGKLRAGRSRNDQVATDLRLYLRDHVRIITARLTELELALIGQAERHHGTPAPGMTHMQHAQPVLLAHQLLAHVQAFARDASRLRDWDVRASVSPLGSGALAGSSLPLDPEAVAAELGFASAADNSMDAVSDRDFAAEFCFVAALLGVHLSRLGEEVVLWSTHEFGWVGDRRRVRHRLVDHAAEEEPGRSRASPRQVGPADRRPHRLAHDAEGPAAHLQPRPAGGQGARLRRGRHAADRAAGDGGPDRHAALPHRAARRHGGRRACARDRPG